MSKKKFAIITLCTITLLVGVGCLLLCLWATADLGNLPPENYTSTSMYPLKTRILRFAQTNNRLPSTLSELPPLEGFSNNLRDVWGNEIKYIVNGSTVSLISRGKDQVPGGVEDNYDVVGVFEAKLPDGSWVKEDSDWKIKPLSDRN